MDSGFVWPVVDANVRYVRPLTLDQRFTVTAALREWELRLVIDYRICDLEGKEFTRGRTVQVPLDSETLELHMGTPELLMQRVKQRLAKGV
jgi:acyl-CoA thioester hydrolase